MMENYTTWVALQSVYIVLWQQPFSSEFIKLCAHYKESIDILQNMKDLKLYHGLICWHSFNGIHELHNLSVNMLYLTIAGLNQDHTLLNSTFA